LEGVIAINPSNNEEVPVFIADYVLANYGTGAVMAVPAHDTRDYAFAKKYDLPIREVIRPEVEIAGAELFVDDGVLINSSKFSGLTSSEARGKITKTYGKLVTKYKLRDWVFSRQRYWGEPIPVIHCTECGVVPVPYIDLPVVLPKVKCYEPTGSGDSPLANISSWVNVKCPKCKGPGKRETNTMPQWAGSSWYYLRYMDPKNDKALVDPKKEAFWSPVDFYVGGAEHAARHLIYARFWHKFLQDIGVVKYGEPFKKLQNVGLIMGEDGRKMSKRYGNVVNPDTIVETYGADTLRLYEMFMGPFDQEITWKTDNIIGVRRFLERVWRMHERVVDDKKSKAKKGVATKDTVGLDNPTEILFNQTIKKVTDDIGTLGFNTAISQMMILVNQLEKVEIIPKSVYLTLIKLLAPFAPHATEELWMLLGQKGSVHTSGWPEYDSDKLVLNTITVMVQVNGRVRDQFNAEIGISKEDMEKLALDSKYIQDNFAGKTPTRVIVVPNKIVNLVY
jgi:leucyl-tRNA synthetase